MTIGIATRQCRTFAIRHSPFAIRHSLFAICHSPFTICHSSFAIMPAVQQSLKLPRHPSISRRCSRTARPPTWGRLVRVGAGCGQDMIELFRRQHIVGREAAHADIIVADGTISRRHCTIGLYARTLGSLPLITLEDHSRNGVHIDGQRVGKDNIVVLLPGSIVQLTPQAEDMKPLRYVFEISNVRNLSNPKPQRAAPAQDVFDAKRTRIMPKPEALSLEQLATMTKVMASMRNAPPVKERLREDALHFSSEQAAKLQVDRRLKQVKSELQTAHDISNCLETMIASLSVTIDSIKKSKKVNVRDSRVAPVPLASRYQAPELQQRQLSVF